MFSKFELIRLIMRAIIPLYLSVHEAEFSCWRGGMPFNLRWFLILPCDKLKEGNFGFIFPFAHFAFPLWIDSKLSFTHTLLSFGLDLSVEEKGGEFTTRYILSRRCFPGFKSLDFNPLWLLFLIHILVSYLDWIVEQQQSICSFHWSITLHSLIGSFGSGKKGGGNELLD